MKSRHIFYLIMFLASIVSIESLFIQKAQAATFVVTTTNDNGSNTVPTSGSLREAIIIANSTTGGFDTINFNIPASSPGCNATTNVCTITPPAPLPNITAQLFIDGYTQPGASMNSLLVGTNAVLRIELNGASSGAGANGLTIAAVGSSVKGLVINRFNGSGIRLQSNNNQIDGNFLGTDATGTVDFGNGTGVFLIVVNNSSIGNGGFTSRNLISGNGVGINLVAGTGNIVKGTLIGTTANGVNPLGNSTGVRIISTSSNNTIGAPFNGEGNIIAFNTGVGVEVLGNSTGNTIRGNSIHSNQELSGTGLGIDLGDESITLNDALDTDALSNNFQNFPDLLSATVSGGNTVIQSRLNSTPNAAFNIDFYSNAACDVGYGEGQTYIGSTTATTNSRGTVIFNATLPVNTTGKIITTTATDSANNTSEFSGCLATGDATTIQVTTTADNGSNGGPTPGSLRAAIKDSNKLGGLKTITFNIPASDPNCNATTNVCTITLPTVLQDIITPVVIDGWSQGGAGYTGPPLIQVNRGLIINAGSSTVQGLILNQAPNGILLQTFGGNLIRGNYIGTDAAGLNRIGNNDGIRITSPENVIGGTNATARNLISVNGIGVRLETPQATANVIQGNYIGTDVNGANTSTSMGNSDSGVHINTNASNNLIGGTASGEGNLIAFTGGTGSGVFISNSIGNSIRGNSIRNSLVGLGIDLSDGLVTPNDAGDPDTGANNLQNFPVITNAAASPGSATISGTLNSIANTQFAIDFYSSPSCHSSGNGEGANYLGSTTVTTDNSGNANFNETFALAPGIQSITTTATLISTGDTSEFSACSAIEILAVNSPDLTITKTHNGNFAQGQTNAQYFVTVTNSGNASSNGTVTVTDLLPNGLTATGITGNGWNCTLGNLTCTRNDALAAGNSYPAITLTVNVVNNAPLSVTNTATVSGGGETNTANNTANDVTNVNAVSADLGVTVTDSPNTIVRPGSNIIYQIQVTNNGHDAAQQVSITDNLPGTVTLQGVSAPGLSCQATTSTVTCTTSSLAAGSTVTLTVTVQVNADVPPGTIISNSASASSNTVDPNNNNNTATATTTVVAAHTGPLMVDNTTDNPDLWACTEAAANDCSLRGAIEAANSGDTISFDATVFSAPQIIEIATAELLINKNLTINGTNTTNLTVRRRAAEGTPEFRIFRITSVQVTIKNLIITGGHAGSGEGGGIYKESGGSMTLDRVSITGNTAAMGGGIFNAGDALSVISSTISGNTTNTSSAGTAGGIHNDNFGTLTITNSTISGNGTPNGMANAGGIQHIGGAGGTMTLTNSTITDNFASGSGSAGGVRYVGGTAIVRNTIIAANQNNTDTPDVSSELSFTSNGYNLIGNVGDATGFNQPGDQVGGNVNPIIDPKLAPLADNGGATQTHALLPDSPAIDKGNSPGFNTDQRELARPFDNPDILPALEGDNSDIGAFELQTDVTAPDTTIDSNPTNPSNSSSASFSFTGSAPSGSGIAGFECNLDGSSFTACTNPQTYNSLSDGSHTFMVRAIDNADNTDATPASFTWTIDTVSPDTSVTSNPTNPTNNTNAGFSFTGSDPGGSGVSGFECDLDGGGFSPCTSPKNYMGLNNGSHTFQVRVIDNAGNTDATPASFTWTVDTIAPTVSINQAAGQTDPANGMGITIHFRAVFNKPVTGFGNSASDVTLSGTAGATTAVVTEIAPFDGITYDVAVSGMIGGGTVVASIPANAALDATTNPNAASNSTDNTVTYVPNSPPTANLDSYSTNENTPLNVASPGVLSNDTDPDMGNTFIAVLVSEPGNDRSFSLNADGSFSYTPNPNFNGMDSFTYKARDDNSADSNIVTVSLTITAVNDAPNISGAAITRQQTAAGTVSTIATVSDVEEAAGSLTVMTTSVPLGITVTGITNTNGSITATVTAGCGAAVGANTVGLKVTDSGNGMGTANLTVNVTAETTSPVINPISNVVATLPPNSNATSMVVNFPLPTAADNCGGAVTVTTNPVTGSMFPIGTTTVNVTATDQAGNQSFTTFTVTVQYQFSWFNYSGLLFSETQLNQVTAGSNVPIRFTLSGYKGDPYSSPPVSQPISCSTFAPTGSATVIDRFAPDPSYSPMFDFYQTTWRTQANWKFTCRRLTLYLNDGTTRWLNFYFK